MRDVINDRVKHREPFRPFAPAILEERVADMLVARNVKRVSASAFMALQPSVVRIAAAGLTLDPVLAAARAQWAAPPPRRQAPRGLDGLVPHIPPKRR